LSRALLRPRLAAPGLRAALCVLLAFCATAALAQERAVEVYRAQERPAEELVGMAQTALGDEGSAAVDGGTNSLILLGSPAAVSRALELVRMQDRGRRNVVLRYESRRRDEIAAVGIRIDWSVGAGSLRVGNVIVPGPEEGARVRSSALASERRGGFQGLVRVLDGEVGHIGSGRSVPVRSFDELAFVEAERGFLARPKILGDGRVRVEISANEGQLLPGGRGGRFLADGTRVVVEPDSRSSRDGRVRVGLRPGEGQPTGRTRFIGADTTVIVRPGETVALGEISRHADSRESGARVLRSERTSDERILLLTVELEGDPAPGRRSR